ncbi:hypothetical protein D3C78_1428290 [compost metagenome]
MSINESEHSDYRTVHNRLYVYDSDSLSNSRTQSPQPSFLAYGYLDRESAEITASPLLQKTGQSWWYLTIIDLFDVTLKRYLCYEIKAFDVRTNDMEKSSYGYYMGYMCYWLNDNYNRHWVAPPLQRNNPIFNSLST